MALSKLSTDFNEYFLTCQVCLERYVDPRMLPCVHAFCLKCLRGIVEKTKAVGTFPCPLCRDDIPIPKGGLQDLKKFHFVTNMLDFMSENTILEPTGQSDVSAKCVNCETKPATLKCHDCDGILCNTCSSEIHKIKIMQKHTIKPYDGSEVPTLKRKTESICDKHNEPLLFYCSKDEQVICLHCKLTSHEGHPTVDLDAAAETHHQEIKSLASALGSYMNALEKNRKEVATYEKEFLGNVRVVEDEINHHTTKLYQMVDNYSSILLDRLQHIRRNEKKQIDANTEAVNTKYASAKSIHELMEQLAHHGNPTDLIHFSKQGRQQISQYIRATIPGLEYRLQLHFSPSDVCDDDIQSLFGQLGQKKQQQVPAKLSPSVLPSTLTQHMVKHHSFTAAQQGLLGRKSVLGVDVNIRDEIAVVDTHDSSVNVFSSDGNLLNTIHTGCQHDQAESMPMDVVFLHEDQIAVTDINNQSVKLFNMQGMLLTCIPSIPRELWQFGRYGSFNDEIESHLKRPRGITVNSKKEILVSDDKAKRVFIHSPDGSRILNTITGLQDPFCVTTSKLNDDIIVGDNDLPGIKVFNSSGIFLFQYGGQIGDGPGEFDGPYGVCTDQWGQIFVGDYGNHRVHLLNHLGEFQCFILTKQDGLECPQALAMDNHGHLVVGEGQSGQVKIFRYA